MERVGVKVWPEVEDGDGKQYTSRMCEYVDVC